VSKNSVGKVVALFLSKETDKIPLHVETMSLDAKGVVGDRFYDKNELRAILLTSVKSYTTAKEHSIEMELGSLGENIIIDFDPYELLPGDRLEIGDVTLELVQNCTLCKGLSKVHPKLPKLLKDGRGVFVKAITEGCVKKGDNVYLLSH